MKTMTEIVQGLDRISDMRREARDLRRQARDQIDESYDFEYTIVRALCEQGAHDLLRVDTALARHRAAIERGEGPTRFRKVCRDQ